MDYSVKDIARIVGGGFSGTDNRVDSVTTDSRHSFGADQRPLFVAIRGLNHDGHIFIGGLYRRGVRAFIVEQDVDATQFPGAGFVRVDRSLRALQALAADYRKGFGGMMVGITGSGGKTTVKEWIARTAPEGHNVFRSPRSYNSQLGVPLSVLMIGGREDVAVIEAGISRPGEMERLAKVISPTVGIFTGIGPEHGENFSSQREKAAEKARLFAGCTHIIYDGSPDTGEILHTAAPGAALVDASQYRSLVPFTDKTDITDGSLVVAFNELLGQAPETTAAKLKLIDAAPMRLGLSEGLAGSLIVGDAHNSDINSLPISLDYLSSVAAGRPKAVIMSDIMFSSLPDAELYRRAAAMVRGAGVDLLIGVGERICRLAQEFGDGEGGDLATGFFRTPAEFLANLTQDMFAGHAVLVRGGSPADFSRIVHQLERRTHTTVLEVDLDAMTHNLNWFRSLLGAGTKLMAMVKASGYGNGEFEVANLLQTQGVDYLAVAFADEGVRLREQGISAPIVVLNADSDSFELMAANRLEPEIYSSASLRSFVAAVRAGSADCYPVHIKLDSGMHRLGFGEGDLPELIGLLARERDTVRVRSVFSHLAAADDPMQDEFTRGQIALFERLSRSIGQSLGYMPLRHIANSAAMERFPEARYDMCRLGVGLYGISSEVPSPLRPVSRLATRIVQIRELDAGQTVGYGREGVLTHSSRLAVLPVGYADGLDRRLGCGRWSVMIGGKPAPTVGRISMDSCVVDISGIDAVEGDQATVFGGAGQHSLSEMARVLDTIPYEVMTSVSERVKRIFIKE